MAKFAGICFQTLSGNFDIFYVSTLFEGFNQYLGWSGGAIVLGKLPVPGRPTVWITVGQGPTALKYCLKGP